MFANVTDETFVLLRYEPSLDVHKPQFHPLPQPPLLPPVEPACPAAEGG